MLSTREKEVLSSRFTIIENKIDEYANRVDHVFDATISAVSAWLVDAQRRMQHIEDRLEHHENNK